MKSRAVPENKIDKYKVKLVMLLVAIIMASVYSLHTTLMLPQEADKNTEQYVMDVTQWRASDINGNLKRMTMTIEIAADSVGRLGTDNNEVLMEFLNRKAVLMDFEGLWLIDKDNDVYQVGDSTEDMMKMESVSKAWGGDIGIATLSDSRLMYSAPVRRDGKVIAVLSGIRSREGMQYIIQPKSFDGKGVSCIVNTSGKIIVAPRNNENYLLLNDIFKNTSDERVAADTERIKADVASGRPGIYRFVGHDNKNMLLIYRPLKYEGWLLLTIVPANLLSKGIDDYIDSTLISVILIVILLTIVYWSMYNNHRQHQLELEKIAYNDDVTGLMNSNAFQRRCRQIFDAAEANEYTIAFLNVKNFKLFNTKLGSECGNEILKLIGCVLSKFEYHSFAGRMYADQFCICLDVGEHEKVEQLMRSVKLQIEEEANAYLGRFDLPSSFIVQSGAYIVDNPAQEIRSMMDYARLASQSRTPAEDGLCIFYDDKLLRKFEEQHNLNALFEESLAAGDFKVFLQPKVSCGGEKVSGAEALVRWQHPSRGFISPADFIPLFETNGNICKLDLYVFEQVCATVQRWQQQGRELIPISVNMSVLHFNDKSFMDKYYAIAQKYDVPRNLLELELTEAVFIDSDMLEKIKEQIDVIHEMGFLFTLDDFGSGISSLNLFRQLDVDVIKLDRGLVTNENDFKGMEILSAVTGMARKLGVRIVAEGIETIEQLRCVEKVSCDSVQGFFYSKPLPIESFETWSRSFDERVSDVGGVSMS